MLSQPWDGRGPPSVEELFHGRSLFLSSRALVYGVGALAFPRVHTAQTVGITEDRESLQRTLMLGT